MFGLIAKMMAGPGQRETLLAILLDGVADMPGCLSYVVARDPADADALWITEVWESRASHEASLSLPSVQEAIAQARPLIAGFGERFETEPVGGHGLIGSEQMATSWRREDNRDPTPGRPTNAIYSHGLPSSISRSPIRL